ncbi:MAG TPA: bifunctional precorrin-2 dehydrogenase/sirohydrochlorin ferrochelatase, partial [Dehalococcoidia bacterium]|nr:bifunctional precorrin-2 dehydrogenase/sirohydrochlorin ferrochelatase [Dehalococcoidia bacterium]
QLEDLARDGAVTVCRRTYTPGDMKGAYLAIVGTEDVGINHEAASEARREGVLVNTVDDIPYCDFAAPAVVQQGDLTVAISTNGKSPAMARRMREELESYLTPDYADLLNVMAKVRITLLRQRIRPRPDRWQEHIDAELRDLIKQGDLQMAQDYLLAKLVESAGQDGTLTQAERPGATAS